TPRARRRTTCAARPSGQGSWRSTAAPRPWRDRARLGRTPGHPPRAPPEKPANRLKTAYSPRRGPALSNPARRRRATAGFDAARFAARRPPEPPASRRISPEASARKTTMAETLDPALPTAIQERADKVLELACDK